MDSNDSITPLLQAEQPPVLTREEGKPSECRLADNSCFLNDGSSIPGRDQLQVQRKLIIACVLCFFFMVMEVVGGWLANSVAIMSDAAHMFSDMSAFAVALFAAWAVTRKSHASYSFGYHRAEIVGALVSIAIIWLVTGALVYEAILRTITPVPVDGKMMFIVATGALLFNLALMLVVGQHHHHGGSCSHDHGCSGDEHAHSHDHGHGHDHSHGHGSHSCSHSHSHSHQTPIKRRTVETLSVSPAINMRTRSGLSSALLSPSAVPSELQRVVVETGEMVHHKHVNHSHTESSHEGHEHAGHKHGAACCHGHDHQHGVGHSHGHHDHSHDHDHADGHDHDHADDHNHDHAGDHDHDEEHDHEHAHVVGDNQQHDTNHSHSHHGCSHSHGHHADHVHDHDHSDSASPSGAVTVSKGLQKDELPPGCQCAVITVDGTGMVATKLSCECVEHGGDHDACMRLGLQLATELARKRQEQQRKVDEAAGIQRPAAGPQEGHLGLRSAAVHIMGDMIQSIGVAMAGALIWWNEGDPRWYYADPICTYLFSIMVLLTTRAVMKDIIDTLMERTPVRYNLQDVAEDMGKFEGIRDVHDLHIWNLAMGLPILTAHIHISSNACPEDVLTTLESYVGGLGISHSTIQICNMPQPSSPTSSGAAQGQ